MPRTCLACASSERAAIDRAIIEGTGLGHGSLQPMMREASASSLRQQFSCFDRYKAQVGLSKCTTLSSALDNRTRDSFHS
jgi:hypothetical protein